MNKKLLSLVLSLVMVLGTFTSAFAAETTTTTTTDEKLGEKVETVEKITGKDNKIQYIIDKKFVEGYENGDYGYDKNIKRSEITKLIVFANGNKALAEKLQGSMKLYNDVDTAFWANGVISVGTTVPSSANGQAMLNGYPDGSFKPEKNVTYAELSKMLVVLVKEDLTADMIKDANAKWATQWMSWAAQLGILDDVTVANSDAPATRADAFTMMYNALYKMQSFKRVPANEKVGVLSSLKKNELILNQDSEQTYKITDDTVFVNVAKNNTSNIIKVKDITNPDYYLGSLVRVMYNDKKEVTHILELGNPEFGALSNETPNNEPKIVNPNNRWNGVADATVQTYMDKDVTTLDKDFNYNGQSYVTFDFNSSKTKAEKINFYNAKAAVQTLRLNDDTKVYVANPYNNQMREVKDINEALSLIGFRNYDGYKVPNVYAGFNRDGVESAVHSEVYSKNNTAKVVVFNVVAKDNDGGKLYRVLESSSSLGSATLEDTDGKKYDRDFFKNVANFPYNYGDKYDVIKVGYKASQGTDYVETKIDNSDKKAYPIVEVTRVYNDKKQIEVKDEYGYKALLDLRDADIFNKDQYKDITDGSKVQFRAGKDKSAIIDILSILPKDSRPEGSLREVVKEAIDVNVKAGKLTQVSKNLQDYTISVDIYNNVFDKEVSQSNQVYFVSAADYEIVKGYEGTDIMFTVRDEGGSYGNRWATNFRDLNDNVLVAKDTSNSDYEAAKAAVANFENAVKDFTITDGAVTTAKAAAKTAIGKLTVQAQVDELQAKFDAAVALETNRATIQTAKTALKALTDATPGLTLNTATDQTESQVKTAIEGQIAGITEATVETVTVPAEIVTGATATANVKITSGDLSTVVTVTATYN